MWDFSIGRALGLMGRTLPFILLRMAVYFGITLGYILVTGMGAGVGWGIGGFGDADFRATTTAWGGLAGFGIAEIPKLFAAQRFKVVGEFGKGLGQGCHVFFSRTR